MISLTISQGQKKVGGDGIKTEWRGGGALTTLVANKENISDEDIRDMMDKFTQAVRANSMDDLQAAGLQLWTDFLPGEITQKLDAVWNSNPPLDLFLEISESLVELPWELLNNTQGFLAEHFNVGRTVMVGENLWNSKQRKLNAPLKILILSNPEGDEKLTHAYEECLTVRDTLEQYPEQFALVTRTGKVHKRFLESGEIHKHDIILFIGHSQYDPDETRRSGWRFGNGSVYGAVDVKNACSLPVPFCAGVIANSCQSANARIWQSQETSLCNAFIRAGVSFFIGTFWDIPDTQAAKFSAALFKELVVNEQTLGQAVRLVRKTLKDNFPTDLLWASYVLYGDPTMKIVVKPEMNEPVKTSVVPVRQEPVLEEYTGKIEAAAARAPSVMPAQQELVAEFTILEKIEPDDYHLLYKARSPQGETVILGIPYIQVPEIALKELARAQKLIALDQPNLVRVLAANQVKPKTEGGAGKFYIVYEYLENAQTLNQILAEARANPDGHLSLEKAREYLLQLCKALQAIHDMGYYHGSLNPENILVTSENFIKVNPKNVLAIPDGKTKAAVGDATQTPLTDVVTAHLPMPQFPYAAPEQFTRNRSDKRSDIWAIGAIAYQLLTGKLLFSDNETSENLEEWLKNIITGWPPRLEDIPANLAATILKAINPDPDLRFQSAAELGEAIQNPATPPDVDKALSELESDICTHCRSGYASLALIADEENRAMHSLSRVARELSVPLYEWSSTEGLKLSVGALRQNEIEVLNWFCQDLKNPGILVLKDFYPYLAKTEVQRRMTDWYILRHQSQSPVKTIVFTSPTMFLTEVLERQVAMFTIPPPDTQEISQLIDSKLPNEQGPLPSQVYEMAWQARGMARREIERVVDLSLLDTGGDFIASFTHNLLQTKGEIIQRTELLEFCQPGINLDDIGGADRLYDMVHNVGLALQAWTWMPVPKGWLLMGVPGAGKSLTAKAIAGELNLPLLRLDMGRIFTVFQGGAEQNMHRAIELCTQLSPVVLWVDEIEKGMGGMTSESAGGPMSRVLTILLSWMQERTAPVFIVATANDASLGLTSPELFRPGRFDAVLFFDRPGPAGRQEIFRILLEKYKLGRVISSKYLPELAQQSEGATGVEIEQAIINAIYKALAEGKTDPGIGDIQASLSSAKKFWIENTPLGKQNNSRIRAMAMLMGALPVTL